MVPYFVVIISTFNMLLAQCLKLPIQFFLDRKWSPMIVFSTGGMPSSHSALVTSLTLSIALTEGISTPYFAISLVFASVIVHDSVGLRREAGKHATVLNKMKHEIQEIVNEVQLGENRDRSNVERNLKELLGHEPFEAFMGVFIGTLTTLIAYFIWL